MRSRRKLLDTIEGLSYDTDPATGAALARAVLDTSKGRRLWRVPRCPFCKDEHVHGAGPDDRDPREFLGPRRAHCEARVLLPDYRLAEAWPGLDYSRLRALALLGDGRAREIIGPWIKFRSAWPFPAIEAEALTRLELFDFAGWCVRRHLRVWNKSERGERHHGALIEVLNAAEARLRGQLPPADLRRKSLSADTAAGLAQAKLGADRDLCDAAKAVGDAVFRIARGASFSAWPDFRAWVFAGCERATWARGQDREQVRTESEAQRAELIRRLSMNPSKSLVR